jgi:endonuclease/exonuclease/phosphatase family metal-dependent hydrolase
MARRHRLIVPALSLLALALSPAAALAGAPRIGEADPRPKPPGAIRLATYNVENLFDDRDDPSLTGRHDDCHSRDKTVRAKPESQLRAVADTIRRLDADIIGLQEIESYDALIEFREAYLKDLGYDHAISIDVGQERGIEQAVLSRFPVKHVRVWPNMDLGGVHPEKYGDKKNWYAGEPIQYRRSPLHVRVHVPASDGGADYELDLFVVHHKSGRYNDYWREKEADALVGIVDRLRREGDRNIAILGDFNATPDERSVRTYIDAGFAHALDHSSGDPATLTHSSGRAIDFILLGPGLRPEVVEGSGFALGTPQIPADADYRTAPKPEGYAADHIPVAVDLVPRER